MHSSENEVLSLRLTVDNVCCVFLVEEVALVVGIPYVCYEVVHGQFVKGM